MATPMHLVPDPGGMPKVPLDSFGVRLAMIEAEMGMNMTEVATLCELDPENWRKWKRGRRPQDREGICRKIADKTGYDYGWLMQGGPLQSRCFSSSTLVTPVPPVFGQTVLFDPDSLDALPRRWIPVLVGSDA